MYNVPPFSVETEACSDLFQMFTYLMFFPKCINKFSTRIYRNRNMANSIVTYYFYTFLKKVIHQINKKWMVAPFNKFCGRSWDSFGQKANHSAYIVTRWYESRVSADYQLVQQLTFACINILIFICNEVFKYQTFCLCSFHFH